MKRLLILITLCACNGQSRQSMQTEYDSLVNRISLQQRVIKGETDLIDDNYVPDSIKLYFTRRIDSMNYDLNKLEKRKSELAKELFE